MAILSNYPGSAPNMSKFHPIFFIWVILSFSLFIDSCSIQWCPHDYVRQANREFEQKTSKFWEFEEQSNSWVEVKLPFDLLSCVNDNCTKVGFLDQIEREKEEGNLGKTSNERESLNKNLEKIGEKQENSVLLPLKNSFLDQKETEKADENIGEKSNGPDERENLKKKVGKNQENSVLLPLRKRVSLVKMSEASIWVTGPSGSLYERFWNGLQWVLAPHGLPVSDGFAVASFIVNQTILVLSDAGNLYQMQLGENSHPIWVDFAPKLDQSKRRKEPEKGSSSKLKSGVISHDRESIYFCTKSGLLFELNGIEPPRWINHGKPPGANVAAIADAGSVKPEAVFTVSSIGELYEHDRSSKPMWKKHIWGEGSEDDISLMPSLGFSLHGPQSISLFLLTKGGDLVERRLRQRKWKWVVRGGPKDHLLTSITPVSQDESNEKSCSFFLTAENGNIFEYQVPKSSGTAEENQSQENWVNHQHPPHSKAAKGIIGLEFEVGRMIFPLDDGRLGELHLSGIGGETAGPSYQGNIRRKTTLKYIWSILDAPETEGWNAEYCTEERGPSNCIVGIPDDQETSRSLPRWRKGNRVQQNYLSPSEAHWSKSVEDYRTPDNWIKTNFRLRVMHGGRSFFLVTESGLIFEYLNAENMWFWLRHEHSHAMKGAVGNYNGSLFLVDEYRNLLIRERSGNELAWINCTALSKGRHVLGGPPWDRVPGKDTKVTAEDALFFVSRSGRLLQLTVALRKFKWKDCRNPPNTKIASIADQEVFRENIVLVIGKNGKLYQFNKITELWHEHYQSQHLVLSRSPGTATRPSSLSLTGSLFMISEDGKLIEYNWNSMEGWNWVEHGTPHLSVTLVGSSGPCFGGNQLFLIGSDGHVYLRHLDQATWKWRDYAYPSIRSQGGMEAGKDKDCINEDSTRRFEETDEELHALNRNCDPKVSTTRPIPFAEDSMIFELRDGRLGEMRQNEDDRQWRWWRIIGTPTSLCVANHWTALAS